jgi:hypothetical protein
MRQMVMPPEQAGNVRVVLSDPTMRGAVFNVPVLRIEQQSSQLEYDITDETGQLVGKAVQVAGKKPRKGLFGMLGSGLDGARVVVQVNGLDGAPRCYVDHQDGAPVAIMSPEGTLVGRFAADGVAGAQAMAGGGPRGAQVARMALGAAQPPSAHRLLDAADRSLCQIDWTWRQLVQPGEVRWLLVGGDFTDPNGQHIAHLDVREAMHKDRYELRIFYQLPEPLQTLVITAPLALDLTRS